MRRLLGLLLVLLVLPSFAQTEPEPDLPSHVLVISLDGARPDAIQQMDTPHIDVLAARGAYTWAASTTFPPATVPGHASMLTGLAVEEHGIDYNSYAPEPIEATTFLTATHDAGYLTAMVAGKNKLDQFRQDADIPFMFARAGDPSVVNAAIDLLNDGYQVLFVHFPNPDYFGHLVGWMTDAYLYELENTDAQIGRLLAWYEANDLLDQTLIVLTADHGGHEQAHGQNIPVDMLIPWIAAGPGIKTGYAIEDEVSVADTAHTVLYALNLERPESDLGRVVTSIYVDLAD